MMDDALAQADAFFDPAKQHSSGARRPLGHSVTATRAARAVRGAALLAGAAAGGMAAVAGWALLLSLLAARTLAPPAASLARPLYFDYTATPAVAEATFLGEGVAAAAAAAAAIAARKGVAPPASPRAFPPGRRVDVWLAVEAPEDGRPADVFQVRADLLGVDGRVLATASRPALVPPRSRAARALRGALLAPLVVLGLADDLQTLRIPLFSNYRDLADAPAVALRVALAGRPGRGGEAPALARARALAAQRLGPARRLLYLLRPGDFVAWPLYAGAAAAIAGGGGAALACLAIYVQGGAGGGRGGGGGRGTGRGGGRWAGPGSASPAPSASVATDDLGDADGLDLSPEPSDAESDDEGPPSAWGGSVDARSTVVLTSPLAAEGGVAPRGGGLLAGLRRRGAASDRG